MAVPRWSTLACSLSGDVYQVANSATKTAESPFTDAHLSCPFLSITIIAVPVTPYPIAERRYRRRHEHRKNRSCGFLRSVSHTITERPMQAFDIAE